MILQRVANAEGAIGTVSTGITTILGKLDAIGCMVVKDGGGRPSGHTANMQEQHTNVATSSPSEWQHALSHSNADDMVEVATTPNCPEKEQPPEEVERPAAGPKRPIVVDLDNSSSQSADSSADAIQRTRTPASHVKRVHSQPRQRVVPCARGTLAVARNEAIPESSAEGPPSPTLRATRYKDPPGYENVTDFGVSHEPYLKPPLLQPKNHGVSRQLPTTSHIKGDTNVFE